jgi:hypothetical protein
MRTSRREALRAVRGKRSAACARRGQLEVGEVHAGDQQDENDRAEQHAEAWAHVASELGEKRRHDHAGGLVLRGVLLEERLRELIHVAPRRLQGGPRCEPSDRTKMAAGATGIGQGGVVAQRGVDLGGSVEEGGEHGLEPGGKHAHHSVRNPVDRKGPADDARIGSGADATGRR